MSVEVTVQNVQLVSTVTESSSGSQAVATVSPSFQVEVSTVGLQGPPGPQGLPGGNLEKVAAETVLAGQCVRPNPLGNLVLAQADSVNNATGVLVALEAASSGFALALAQGSATLVDWTDATGVANLVPRSNYFLSATQPGKLTTSPPSSGVVLLVGTALDATTLSLVPSAPLTL